MTSVLEEWLAKRGRLKGRFLANYPVNVEACPGKNAGLDPSGEQMVEQGYCPCKICGHRYMYECEASPHPCDCCSSVCS